MTLLLLLLACALPSSSRDSGLDLGVTWWTDPVVPSLIHVAWEQPADASTRVSYTLIGEEPSYTPARWTTAGPAEATIVGVPFGAPVSIEIVHDAARDARGARFVAEAGPWPEGFPEPTLIDSDPGAVEPTGRFLLGSVNAEEGGWVAGSYWLFLLDRKGRLVWAYPGDSDAFTIEARVSDEGDILQDVSLFWTFTLDRSASEIRRLRLDGVVTATYEALWLFNPFCELPDGSIVWASLGPKQLDVLRRWPDGTVSSVWACEGMGNENWCRANSIEYDPRTDRLLLSFPMPYPTVMELDIATGLPVRWYGELNDGWGFDPPESAFVMPHGVSWTDDGTLLVSSQESEDSDVGVVREYVVDEQDEVLRQTWSQGEGSDIRAYLGGGATRLPGGNTLHYFGTTPRVQEVTPEREVVWDLAWAGDRLLGRVSWIEDPYALMP